MRSRAWLLIVHLALALLTACADATRPPEAIVYIPDDSGIGIVLDDGGHPVPAPIPDTDGGPVQQAGHILVVIGENEETINISSSVDLTVLLLDMAGNPVSNASIYWDYDPPGTDVGDAQLSALSSLTDENGEAMMTLIGSSTARDIAVTAIGDDTRQVSFLVHVKNLPTGGVDVGFDYNGPVQLGAVEVYVIDDPAYCDQPQFIAPPLDSLLSGNAESLAQRVTLSPILSNTSVSVLARARLASNGTLAGAGCFGDLRIPEGSNARITLPLFLLPLNPAGTFSALNHFDFTDAIPGTIGDVIRQLVRFFGDENHEREIAGVLFDLVEGLVREAAGAIGGFVVELVRGWIEDDLNEIINNYIDVDGPDWLRDFFLIGSDIISVVSNMEVISEIQITKPRSDGTYDGAQNWIGLAFYWNLPCQGNPDPECARHPFTMDQIANGLEGVNLVFGQFTGRVHTYNHGEVDPHTLDLQYGRLILFVINHLIMPAIADGAQNIHDGLLNLANCPAFADGITGGNDCLEFAGICVAEQDTIEGWCTTVVSVAGDLATGILEGLRLDTRLTLSGTMKFLEETSDLSVDKITDGLWSGTIRTQNDQGPPFSGDFAGEQL